jgi:hypothetical protein
VNIYTECPQAMLSSYIALQVDYRGGVPDTGIYRRPVSDNGRSADAGAVELRTEFCVFGHLLEQPPSYAACHTTRDRGHTRISLCIAYIYQWAGRT